MRSSANVSDSMSGLESIINGSRLGASGFRNGEVTPAVTVPMSDEIGVIIEPTTNFTRMLFLVTVHCYLVLLLIVSVPDSYSTRILVTKKSSMASTVDSESDNDERNSSSYAHIDDDDSSWEDSLLTKHGNVRYARSREHKNQKRLGEGGVETVSKTQMKKALSYFL